MILLPLLIILTAELYDNSFARNIDRRYHRSFDPKIYTTCIDGLGCIEVSEKWYDEIHRPKNLEPLDRHTIRTEFILIKSLQNDSKDLVYDMLQLKSEVIEISGFQKGTCTKFMVHDFTSNGRTGWIKHLVVALASRTNCNLVSIDWEAGAEPPFEQAVVNARVVALEAQAMINMLKVNFSQSVEQIHIIGHGVGSHIAGYIGKNITGMGRITGLDPTGPYFEGMPKEIRLDHSDANYVEVIHTDSYRSKSQGALTQLGHADFYVNNAGRQPGCNDTSQNFIEIKRDGLKEGKILPSCSHKRAFKYFIEAIENTQCQFMSVLCKNFEEFQKGQCFSCDNQACLSFGLQSPTSMATWNHSYYLLTRDKKPFCVLAYTVTMVIDTNTKAKDVEGYFEMILIDSNNVIANATMADSEFKNHVLKPGGRYQFLFYTSPPRLGVIKQAKVKWKRKSSKLCLFCETSVYVSQIEIKPFELEHVNIITSFLCPKKDTTEIKDNDFVTFTLCSSKSCCITPLNLVTRNSNGQEEVTTIAVQVPQKEQMILNKTIQNQHMEQMQQIDTNPKAAHGGGDTISQIVPNQNKPNSSDTTTYSMLNSSNQESTSSYSVSISSTTPSFTSYSSSSSYSVSISSTTPSFTSFTSSSSSPLDKTTKLIETFNRSQNEIRTNLYYEHSDTDNMPTSLIAPITSTASILVWTNDHPSENSISSERIVDNIYTSKLAADTSTVPMLELANEQHETIATEESKSTEGIVTGTQEVGVGTNTGTLIEATVTKIVSFTEEHTQNLESTSCSVENYSVRSEETVPNMHISDTTTTSFVEPVNNTHGNNFSNEDKHEISTQQINFSNEDTLKMSTQQNNFSSEVTYEISTHQNAFSNENTFTNSSEIDLSASLATLRTSLQDKLPSVEISSDFTIPGNNSTSTQEVFDLTTLSITPSTILMPIQTPSCGTTQNEFGTTVSNPIGTTFVPFTQGQTEDSSSNCTLRPSDIEDLCGKLQIVSGNNENRVKFLNSTELDEYFTIPTINPELLVVNGALFNNTCNSEDIDLNQPIHLDSKFVLPGIDDEDWRLIRRKFKDDSRSRKDVNTSKSISKQKKFINATTVKSTLKTTKPISKGKRKQNNYNLAIATIPKSTGNDFLQIVDPSTCADIKEEFDPVYAKIKTKLNEMDEVEANKNTNAAAFASNNNYVESKLGDQVFNIMNMSDEECSKEFGHFVMAPKQDPIKKSKVNLKFKEGKMHPVKGAAKIEKSKITIENKTTDPLDDVCMDDYLSKNDTYLKEQLHSVINALNKKLKFIEATENVSPELKKQKIDAAAISEDKETRKPNIGAAKLKTSSFSLKSTKVPMDSLETRTEDDCEDIPTTIQNDWVKIKSTERENFVELSATLPGVKTGAANAPKPSNIVLNSITIGSEDDPVSDDKESEIIKCKADKLVQNVNNPIYESGLLNNSFHSSFESDIQNNRCGAFNSDNFTFRDVDDKEEVITASTKTIEKSKRLTTSQEEIVPENYTSASKANKVLKEIASSNNKVGAAHGSANKLVKFDSKLKTTEDSDSGSSEIPNDKVFTVGLRTIMNSSQKLDIIIKDRIQISHTTRGLFSKRKGSNLPEQDLQNVDDIKPRAGETFIKTKLRQGSQKKQPIVGAAKADQITVDEMHPERNITLTEDVAAIETFLTTTSPQLPTSGLLQLTEDNITTNHELFDSETADGYITTLTNYNIKNKFNSSVSTSEPTMSSINDEVETICYTVEESSTTNMEHSINPSGIEESTVNVEIGSTAAQSIQNVVTINNVSETEDTCMHNLDEILRKLETSLGQILTIQANITNSSSNDANQVHSNQFKVEVGHCFCYEDLQNTTEVFEIDTESDGNADYLNVTEDDQTTCFTVLETAESVSEGQAMTNLNTMQSTAVQNEETAINMPATDSTVFEQESTAITKAVHVDLITAKVQMELQSAPGDFETTLFGLEVPSEINTLSVAEVNNTVETVPVETTTQKLLSTKLQTELQSTSEYFETTFTTTPFEVILEMCTISSRPTSIKLSNAMNNTTTETIEIAIQSICEKSETTLLPTEAFEKLSEINITETDETAETRPIETTTEQLLTNIQTEIKSILLPTESSQGTSERNVTATSIKVSNAEGIVNATVHQEQEYNATENIETSSDKVTDVILQTTTLIGGMGQMRIGEPAVSEEAHTTTQTFKNNSQPLTTVSITHVDQSSLKEEDLLLSKIDGFLSTTIPPSTSKSQENSTFGLSITTSNQQPVTMNSFSANQTDFLKLSKVDQIVVGMPSDAAKKPQSGQANEDRANVTIDFPTIEVNDGKTTDLLVIDISVEEMTFKQQPNITSTSAPRNCSALSTSLEMPISSQMDHIAICDPNLSKDCSPGNEIDVYVVNETPNATAIEVDAKPHLATVQCDRSSMALDQTARAMSSDSDEELYKAIKMCSEMRTRRKRKRKVKVKRSAGKAKAGKYVVNIGSSRKLSHVPMKVVFDLRENGKIVGTTEYNIVHQENPNSSAAKGSFSSLVDNVSDKPPQQFINTSVLGEAISVKQKKDDRRNAYKTEQQSVGLLDNSNRIKIIITVENGTTNCSNIIYTNNQSNSTFNTSCLNPFTNKIPQLSKVPDMDTEHCNVIFENLKNISGYKVATNANATNANDTCCFNMKDLSKVYHQPFDASEVLPKFKIKHSNVHFDEDENFILDDFNSVSEYHNTSISPDHNSKIRSKPITIDVKVGLPQEPENSMGAGYQDIDIKPQFYKQMQYLEDEPSKEISNEIEMWPPQMVQSELLKEISFKKYLNDSLNAIQCKPTIFDEPNVFGEDFQNISIEIKNSLPNAVTEGIIKTVGTIQEAQQVTASLQKTLERINEIQLTDQNVGKAMAGSAEKTALHKGHTPSVIDPMELKYCSCLMAKAKKIKQIEDSTKTTTPPSNVQSGFVYNNNTYHEIVSQPGMLVTQTESKTSEQTNTSEITLPIITTTYEISSNLLVEEETQSSLEILSTARFNMSHEQSSDQFITTQLLTEVQIFPQFINKSLSAQATVNPFGFTFMLNNSQVIYETTTNALPIDTICETKIVKICAKSEPMEFLKMSTASTDQRSQITSLKTKESGENINLLRLNKNRDFAYEMAPFESVEPQLDDQNYPVISRNVIRTLQNSRPSKRKYYFRKYFKKRH